MSNRPPLVKRVLLLLVLLRVLLRLLLLLLLLLLQLQPVLLRRWRWQRVVVHCRCCRGDGAGQNDEMMMITEWGPAAGRGNHFTTETIGLSRPETTHLRSQRERERTDALGERAAGQR